MICKKLKGRNSYAKFIWHFSLYNFFAFTPRELFIFDRFFDAFVWSLSGCHYFCPGVLLFVRLSFFLSWCPSFCPGVLLFVLVSFFLSWCPSFCPGVLLFVLVSFFLSGCPCVKSKKEVRKVRLKREKVKIRSSHSLSNNFLNFPRNIINMNVVLFY